MEETSPRPFDDGLNYLDALYDVSKSKFGQPFNFAVFNKKVLLDYEWFKEKTKRENPHLNIEQEEIELYISQGLLPKLFKEDGTPGFPLYTPSRIGLIKELKLNFGYDLKKLKQITDFEERMIDNVYTTDELEYSDLPPLDFYLRNLRVRFKDNLRDLKYIEKFSEREKVKKENVKIKKNLRFFKGKKFDDLSDEGKERLKKHVFKLKWVDEYVRLDSIAMERAKILAGFSPYVSVKRWMQEWDTYSGDKSRYFDKCLDGYPYRYKLGDRLFYFGDWFYYSGKGLVECIDFFSTPDFLIEFDENKKIQILIRDPQRVDVKYMRRIEKVYKLFRDMIGIKKSSWGSKSGIRRLKQERDKLLRETYKALRDEKPHVDASRILDQTMVKIQPQFGEISFDRAKRIIYSKKT